MTAPLVPTIDFSSARARLSGVMDAVVHQRRPHVVSRHRGKEQMLLVRPEDLIAMLGNQRLEVVAVYDEGEVTLRIPALGVLGSGDTLDEAIDDLLADLRVYVARFFENPARYVAGRGVPTLALLRFALSGKAEQHSVLGLEAPAAQRDLADAE